MMAANAVKDEPSMEEILASIRRIISEQDPEPAAPAAKQPAAAAPQPAPVQVAAAEPLDDVLELTKVLNDDGTITDLSATGDDLLADDFGAMLEDELQEDAADSHATPDDFDVFAEDGPSTNDAVLDQEEPMDTDLALDDDIPQPAAVPVSAPQPALISEQAYSRSVSAIAGLKAAVNAKHQAMAGPTIEDLTKELLKPMLKEWLDANLPGIVEKVVQQEVRKLTAVIE